MVGTVPRSNAGLALEARDLRLVRVLDGRVPRIVLEVDRLDVPAQAQAAFAGPPGSGKSLLLRALAALERPARGTIRWGALNVAAMDRTAAARWRRETVGIVTTVMPLWRRLTARQYLLLPARFPMRVSRDLRERAPDLLGSIGIPPDAPLTTLARADVRCLKIARALLRAPAIVIADEPTVDLVEREAARIEHALRRLCAKAGSTLILATQDAALAARFDLSFTLADLAVRPAATTPRR